MFDERICLGLPSLAGHSLPEALSKARALGFQSIMALPSGPNAKHSLGPFPTLEYDQEGKRDWLKEAVAGFSRISIHQAWNQDWRGWIDCASLVGARVVTVHAGLPQEDTDEWLTRCMDHWRTVADYAQIKGVRIGIENEGGPRAAYLDLIRGIGHPATGATLDFGHCAYFHEVTVEQDVTKRASLLNETIAATLRELSDHLLAIHVHNVRLADWRDHRCVVHGAIDFPAAFEVLLEIGFEGPIDIELEESEMDISCAKTGTSLHALLHTRK